MSMKLYVGNLAFQTTDEDLLELFSQAVSNQRNAQVVMDRDTGRSRGFGFVEMASKSEGEAAITQFNGVEINGRSWTVNEASTAWRIAVAVADSAAVGVVMAVAADVAAGEVVEDLAAGAAIATEMSFSKNRPYNVKRLRPCDVRTGAFFCNESQARHDRDLRRAGRKIMIFTELGFTTLRLQLGARP